MMLALGLFVFHLKTLPYSSLKRDLKYNWAENKRIGLRSAYQYLGKGDDLITLSGKVSPEISGISSQLSLFALEYMAASGRAWPLIEGSGKIYGMYIIDSFNYTNSELFSDGSARSIDFSLTLKRVDESLSDMFGDLYEQAKELYDTKVTPALTSLKATVESISL
ncbi:phage tail protein [Musicola paradisiaca]|uniref:P2 GpU family protein n=1 Tax=Musicola paradisiaca (strain Ech703) TaxID=579405 RepID=C6C6Z7_MUSP7|nr:phage tail protein [Musicola paradisiaca]ACS85891.1 P2 GpU family protein [Musicola paradisiaca Ech703]